MIKLEEAQVGIILQARIGSTRLPGKVLMNLAGKPLIHWCIESLRQISPGIPVVVATSKAPQDETFLNRLTREKITTFVGDEQDVLDRYYQCALKFGFKHILRATGDNPLVSSEIGRDILRAHLKNNNDYTAMLPAFQGQLPLGVGTEVFSFLALETSWRLGKSPNHREHVNEYIHENLEQFRTQFLRSDKDWSLWPKSVTIDTAEDLKTVENFITKIHSR